MGAIKIAKQDLPGYQNIFCRPRSSRKILVGTKKDFDVYVQRNLGRGTHFGSDRHRQDGVFSSKLHDLA